MAATFQELVTLEKMECNACAGVFALNAAFLGHARTNSGGYTCPYCKTGWSWTESESDRLRKQLDEKARELSSVKCELLNETQHRQTAERKLKRVNRGVCPCCNRTFSNLARHMAHKHAGERGVV